MSEHATESKKNNSEQKIHLLTVWSTYPTDITAILAWPKTIFDTTKHNKTRHLGNLLAMCWLDNQKMLKEG